MRSHSAIPQENHAHSVRRQLWVFGGVALLALVGIAAGAVLASRAVARHQALSDSEGMATRLAELLIGPLLGPALGGSTERLDELNRAVTIRKADGYLTQVTVWDADGQVLYADNPDQIGRRLDPPAEVTAAIADNVVTSGFADQPEVTNPKFDPTTPGFVEVYVPLHLAGQPPLAFEVYFNYQRVTQVADSILAQMLPVVLIPLVVLQMIQVPIAISFARRVRRHEADRALMLELTLSGSDRERVRIAADLHDGPIQDLAGIGYALGAVEPAVAEVHRPLMRDVGESLHRAIDSLRRMMVDLYPPDLSADQLPATLTDLAVPLQDRGIHVDVHTPSTPIPPLDAETITTIYRVARETLANVREHARASHVDVRLGLGDADIVGDDSPVVSLRVTDNGIGVDPERLDRRAEGHLGLRLLQERVRNLGGTLTVSPGHPAGTVVTVVLPISAAPPPTQPAKAAAEA